MKKKYEKILIFIGILWLVYEVLSLSGILTFYKSPTIANEPAIELNSYFAASNLSKINKGDIICFNHDDQFLGKHKRVYRLVAKENDIVEIIDGVLFVNGNNFDQN